MLFMGKVNSSLTRNDSMMHLATEPGTVRTFSDDTHTNVQHAGKWPVWVRLLIRNRVCYIDNVILVNKYFTGSTKLVPLIKELSILVKDLDT